MVTLAICLIAGIVIALVKEWYWIDGIGDFIMESILGGLIGGLIGVILMLALPMKTEINTYTYKIETFQDNNSVSGSFFLGSGSIDGKMKYVFYYEVNGGFKMAQIDYDDAIIKYSDNVKAIRYKEEPTDAFINWFAVDIYMSDTYEIFVPKGTIKSNYNLDAQ